MGRTYSEILQELKQFVKQRWPNWNTEAKHIGNIILECLADQLEKQEYRYDRMEEELFLDEAASYKSILRWARLVGFEVQSAKPAETVLTFSVDEPAERNIIIPLGTVVSTPGPEPVIFTTTAGAVLQAGQTSIEIPAQQVENKTDIYTGTGEPHQAYQTRDASVWMESLRVVVAGKTWIQVNNFLYSTGTDEHYEAELREDGSIMVVFGNGINGKAPGAGEEIRLIYKTTQGQKGNVQAGEISILETVLYDTAGYLADVKVTNKEAAAGGEDQDDKNYLREAIPAWIPQNLRCVTKNDYQEAVGSVRGVIRVLAQTKEDDDTIPPLTVKIYPVPEEGGEPSQELIYAVINEVTVVRPKLLTVAVDVLSPEYLTVNVECTVSVSQGYEPSKVQEDVEQAIKEFFSYARKEEDGAWAIDFGKPVYLSKLMVWVMTRVAGVANISFTVPGGDVFPGAKQIPALGTVTVNVA